MKKKKGKLTIVLRSNIIQYDEFQRPLRLVIVKDENDINELRWVDTIIEEDDKEIVWRN